MCTTIRIHGHVSTSLVLLLLFVGCGQPTVRSTLPTAPSAAQLAELWVEPSDLERRDLFHGPGGPRLVPDPKAAYVFVAKDTTGSSRGYDVRDPSGLVWDVKIGVEAQPEVVASRLHWAAGYHQPPTYYVTGWTLTGSDAEGPQPPARFRPKLPWLDKIGEWSWQENPFVDTEAFRGLVVLNLMLNNWDFKTSNNALYQLPEPREGARRWYVVKDIGSALGKTPARIRDGRPNDLEAFERQGFIKGVEDGRVRFDYLRPHRELLERITPRDVRWACERLNRLSSRQWNDAFRAAGYTPDQTERYVRKLQAKIAEGMRLAP